MRREYRQRPGDVIERRIETAARNPGKTIDGTGQRSMALLAMRAVGDQEGTRACRAVARYVLARHSGDLSVRDELLSALGLDGGER
jgi:hypothetical protein